MTDEPFDITRFGFTHNNIRNKRMLERRSEEAYDAGVPGLAAQLAIAAGLYGLLDRVSDILGEFTGHHEDLLKILEDLPKPGGDV